LAGAPTAGFVVAVGAEDPLGNGLFVGVVLFAVDESMGDQLTTACAMVAGKHLLVSIEFQSEAMQGVEIRKK
jgi:hypothetical protein